MKRMTGIILMTIGVLTFGIGLVVYLPTIKANKRALNHKESDKDRTNKTANTEGISATHEKSTTKELEETIKRIIAEGVLATNEKSAKEELDKIIVMAIADGVLTHKERSLIKQYAEEKGLDYDRIIKDAENRLASLNSDAAETELIDQNKKNGTDFEKHIIQRFNKKYFTIKEWAGDKYINGYYAKTTQQPDILLELNLRGKHFEFSVECKWTSLASKKEVKLGSPLQFERYHKFEKERNIPVFIAIGIGGKGAQPKNIYIIPLKSMTSNFISMETLKDFEKKDGKDFYFDPKTNELK